MPDGFLGIFGHQALELGLGLFVFEIGRPCPGKDAGEFGPGIGALISTMRTASILGFGGSTPNSWGGSPFSTQRQNFRSAVTIRC